MVKEAYKLSSSRILSFYIIVTFIAVVVYKTFIRNTLFHVDDRLIIHIFLGILISLPIIAINYLLMTKTSIFKEFIEYIREHIAYLDHFEIIAVALFSGIGEEILFRGILQHFIGFIFASLGFGLMHIGPTKKYLPWTLFALIMGFFLGSVRIYFGSLIVPIVIHACVNYASFRFLFSMNNKALN